MTSAKYLGFWTPFPPCQYRIHATSLPLVRMWSNPHPSFTTNIICEWPKGLPSFPSFRSPWEAYRPAAAARRRRQKAEGREGWIDHLRFYFCHHHRCRRRRPTRPLIERGRIARRFGFELGTEISLNDFVWLHELAHII